MTTIKGYSAGKGITFTPSKDATWVEDFNAILLHNENIKRNALTEVLIKEGLKSYKNNSNSSLELKVEQIEPYMSIIDYSRYSKEELELLNTSIVKNAINMFIDNVLRQHTQLINQSFEMSSTQGNRPSSSQRINTVTTLDDSRTDVSKNIDRVSTITETNTNTDYSAPSLLNENTETKSVSSEVPNKPKSAKLAALAMLNSTKKEE